MDDPRSHKRFGAIATQLGLLTPTQLSEGLKRQMEDVLTGKPHRAIGQILREMGFLSAEQIDKVTLLQKRKVQVPSAPGRLGPFSGRGERPSASSVALEDR